MSDMLLSPEMLGYFTEDDLQEVPDDSGVYCVYKAGPDQKSGEMEPQELVYVGEGRDVRSCLIHHEDKERWHAGLKEDQALWFSVGLCGHANRERLAAALVHRHKPLLNHQYIDTFPFDRTVVHLMGKKGLLMNPFTVERKDP